LQALVHLQGWGWSPGQSHHCAHAFYYGVHSQ
jgi:hypothetical protein